MCTGSREGTRQALTAAEAVVPLGTSPTDGAARDRQRGRNSGECSKRSADRESAAEPSAPPEPLRDVNLRISPKPPKKINLAHSSTEPPTAAASGIHPTMTNPQSHHRQTRRNPTMCRGNAAMGPEM